MNFYDNVAAAADYLDTIFPNWEDKIDVADINMKHNTKCILGQLYGEFCFGLKTISDIHGVKIPNKSVAFGVFADVDAWKYEIEKRRKVVELTEEEILSQMKVLQGKLDKLRDPDISITLKKSEWIELVKITADYGGDSSIIGRKIHNLVCDRGFNTWS